MSKKARTISLLFLFACVACVPPHKAAALKGVERFHQQYNGAEFQKIYEDAYPEAQTKISREQFVEDMDSMRRGQGAVLSSKEIGTDYNYESGVSMVKVSVETVFEKGTAKEEFIFYFPTDSARLASYRFLGPRAQP